MNLDRKAAGKVEINGNVIGGYGLLFGSPEQRDLQGEYFTAYTNFQFDLFPPEMRRPSLYDHGQNQFIGDEFIGVTTIKDMDNRGIFFRTELSAAQKYLEEIKELIRKGVLRYSSGTAAQLRSAKREDGWIQRWPIIEASLTPRPAEWRLPALEFVRNWYCEKNDEIYSSAKSLLAPTINETLAAAIAEMLSRKNWTPIEKIPLDAKQQLAVWLSQKK
jgi:phage head maturation protease